MAGQGVHDGGVCGRGDMRGGGGMCGGGVHAMHAPGKYYEIR